MIERTLDYRRVKRLAPWPLVISSKVIYLIDRQDNEDVGLWTFHEFLDGFKIHADLGPKCRGKNAIQSIKESFKWIFNSFSVDTIYAEIPVKNKCACLIAAHSGMEFTEHKDNFRFYKLRR